MFFQWLLLLMLSVPAVIHSAASEIENLGTTLCAPTLQFQDCFERRFLHMNGTPRYYESLLVWEKFVAEGVMSREHSSTQVYQDGSFFRPQFCYSFLDARAGMGFVEGSDQELTAEVHEKMLEKLDNCGPLLDFNIFAQAALRLTIDEFKQTNPDKLEQLHDMSVEIEAYHSGSDVWIVAPPSLKAAFAERHLDITDRKHVALFKKICQMNPDESTHAVPYLLINAERLQQFAAQEHIGLILYPRT